jgi:hypothetical protein
MLIFQIDKFWIISVSEVSIKARVGWADDGTPDYDMNEEVQDIEWCIQHYDNLEDALSVAEYLIDNKLIRSDKISIDYESLFNRLFWKKDRFDAAVNTLLSIKVDMLDCGKKVDHFFVHF